eukprot:238660_1
MIIHVLVSILFPILTLSKDSSSPFKVWETALPDRMTLFGVGIYENVLQTFSGSKEPQNCWTPIDHAFTLNLTDKPREWTKTSIDYVPYNASLIMHLSDATMNNLVYSANPNTNAYGDQQTLYIYNLETHQYLNEKT